MKWNDGELATFGPIKRIFLKYEIIQIVLLVKQNLPRIYYQDMFFDAIIQNQMLKSKFCIFKGYATIRL